LFRPRQRQTSSLRARRSEMTVQVLVLRCVILVMAVPIQLPQSQVTQ